MSDNNIVEIKAMRNGPLLVKGNFILLSTQGEELEVSEETWLCRCGHSKTKPFCDGTHKTIGLKD